MDLRIAARKSDLARLQAYQVGDLLEKRGFNIDYYFRTSLGDQNQNDPLWKMPEKGVFTEDFREGLINGEWDMVVHSWKDLPVDIGKGTQIVATLPRADLRDLFLFKKAHRKKLSKTGKLVVFSSSPRRIYNLTPFFKKYLPWDLHEVRFENVRGNINTRIRKMLENPEVDGLIVAKAAIDRMLLANREEFKKSQTEIREALSLCDFQVLPLTENPTAAAQGALAIEISDKRKDLKESLLKINCESTWKAVCNERRILKSHGGGCHQKIGVSQLSRDYGEVIYLKGETEEGETLEDLSVKDQKIRLKKPFTGKLELFERKDLKYPLEKKAEANCHFIAKASCLQGGENFEDNLLWVAGMKTWLKLAEKGHWVHGSTESLGEKEDPQLKALWPEQKWLKWTHKEGTQGEEKDTLLTYELVEKEQDLSFLEEYKEFFWSSGSQFEHCLNKVPEIAKARHFCGPGHTFRKLSKVLKERGIENKPEILPNRSVWEKLIQ